MKVFTVIFTAILIWTSVIMFGVSIAFGEVLHYDDFEDGQINPKYEFKLHKGKWVESNGIITQTQETPGDHTYLVFNGDFEEPHTALVMIRVDKWEDHDLSRCGLGFRLDVDNGAGYAFLIHYRLNNMEFLNDRIAWKNNDTPPPFGAVKIGVWYWMKAEISPDGLKGKIWKVGESEPENWLLDSPLDFGRVRPASGQVGLNGGSNSIGYGAAVVSFDNWLICETAEECTPETVSKLKDSNNVIIPPLNPPLGTDINSLDVNGDGQVNILDLVVVASSFGEAGESNKADVNGDGVVNIQDLVLVANGMK